MALAFLLLPCGVGEGWLGPNSCNVSLPSCAAWPAGGLPYSYCIGRWTADRLSGSLIVCLCACMHVRACWRVSAASRACEGVGAEVMGCGQNVNAQPHGSRPTCSSDCCSLLRSFPCCVSDRINGSDTCSPQTQRCWYRLRRLLLLLALRRRRRHCPRR